MEVKNVPFHDEQSWENFDLGRGGGGGGRGGGGGFRGRGGGGRGGGGGGGRFNREPEGPPESVVGKTKDWTETRDEGSI